MEENYFETNEKYSRGFIIDEYRGEISLVAANAGKDGKIYKEWIAPLKDKAPKYKENGDLIQLPLKIKLGDSVEAALDTLRQIAGVLKASHGTEQSRQPKYTPPVASRQDGPEPPFNPDGIPF